MNPLPGYVYFDANFEFEDGTRGRKLFVVLCYSPNDSDILLVARATTTIKSTQVYGCHTAEELATVFFVPKGGCILSEDTWVQFDYLCEYRIDALKLWNPVGELSLALTKDLLLCASRSDLLAIRFKQALEELGKAILV